MRISYLIADFPKPSETFVAREILSLRRLGMDVRVFAFAPPNPADAGKLDADTRRLMTEVEYITAPKLALDALKSPWRLLRGWRAHSSLHRCCTFRSNKLLRLLRALSLAQRLEAAGIRHLHAHWPYATQVAWLVHKMTNLPISASIHAHEVEYDAGHFPLVFDALRFATFCNRAAMEHLLERLPASARGKCHLVYHGVDLERFMPLPFPRLDGPLRVVSAGRLTRTKGFDQLVRACARFRSQGGEVELTILGQGRQEAELRQLAAELDFADYFHLPGWVPHDQVATHLAKAHLFALMAGTEFHDGLPNVALEAMASACPVMLSPLPAAAEAVTDGVEGFILSSPDDVEEAAKVLRQCVTDPSRLANMGRAARQRMEKGFDATVHASHLKGLFEQLSCTDESRVGPKAGELSAAGPVNSRQAGSWKFPIHHED